MSRRTTVVLAISALLAALPASARAAATGGMAYGAPASSNTVKAQSSQGTSPPAVTASLGADGLAIPPAGAPAVVVAVIAAANRIATLPYRYGGGHGSFDDTAYDCSGSVSYALHGAQLLDLTLDSTGLAHWGERGAGTWITIYGSKAHAYMVVAGLRFDTSGRAKGGTRWQAARRSARGFSVRHPAAL
jgi:cell wall-associated NlpC family hydrolase